MIMKKTILYILFLLSALPISAQSRLEGIDMSIEASATASSGDYAPLWLSANRYGLGSVRPYSNYERVRAERSLQQDSTRSWRLGYGLDVAVAFGHERTGIVEQAYAEGSWKILKLTLGAKQQPLETQNPELCSGALSMGINARPIPQARLDIDWFTIPGTKGWWQWKLNGSYGYMTDGSWQESWSGNGCKYAKNTLYHEKAVYWKFGRTDILPFTYEIGLRMASEFGGSSYNVQTERANDNQLTNYNHPTGPRAFIDALFCRGSDATDGSNPNVAGNHLGSYIMQLKYHGESWQARAYWERFFEDHSMLTVQYGIRDMLLGTEVTLPKNPYVSSVVAEYLSTTDQSGAVYHDGTKSLPDAMAGRDEYYNHTLYAGWQYYGQGIGHPLLTAPLYNKSFGRPNLLYFSNNRVKALHLGLSGDPCTEWHWRLLATFSHNWGTYYNPLDDILSQNYFLGEATYRPRWADGWQATVGLGLDQGSLIGNSVGAQVTLRKLLRIK